MSSYADASVLCTASVGEYCYLKIPAQDLRQCIDSLFPYFSKNAHADYLAGLHHRYKGGHDILIDVPKTFSQYGFKDGVNHLCHILLTDFPTKAGIPIPGFSASGLGKYLTAIGIPKGYLSFSLFEGSLSIFAVAEGYADLVTALSGELSMSPIVAFDTFGEGIIEIIGATLLPPSLSKGLLFCAGLENIVAGCISIANSISTLRTSLECFLGTSLSAMLFSGSIVYLLNKNKHIHISEDKFFEIILKSGACGALSAIFSPFLAFGCAVGLCSFELGKNFISQIGKDLYCQSYNPRLAVLRGERKPLRVSMPLREQTTLLRDSSITIERESIQLRKTPDPLRDTSELFHYIKKVYFEFDSYYNK